MNTVIVSPKYQVVIPKEIRDRLQIQPGQKIQVFNLDDQIILVPVMSIEEARGFLKGIDTTIEREEDRL